MSLPYIDPGDIINPGGGGGGDTGGGGGGGVYTAPLSLSTSSFNIGNVGSSYFTYLNATDGYPPYTWSISSGALPNGLTIDSSGSISGTPTTAGTFNFTLTVSDSAGNSVSKPLSIQINGVVAPNITTTSLPSVLINGNYNVYLYASGGTIPYTNWQIIYGALPTGITLNSATGVLSGIPTVHGNYTFTVQVTDSNSLTDIQSLTIAVRAPSPAITTTSLSDAITGINYSAVINATGGTTPYVRWEILSGELPNGLSLISHASSATISGIPTVTASVSFTVRVTDSLGETDNQIYTLNVDDGKYPIVSTITLPDGKIGDIYNVTLSGAGGSLPYQWRLSNGDLPKGLVLNTLTGVISGTPTKNGSYIFTIEITDKNGNKDTQILSIIIGNYLIPSIVTESIPNGIINKTYYTHIQVVGGTAPYLWSSNITLPDGLSLDVNTGVISGTPTAEGTYTFNISVKDNLNQINTKSFTLQIGDGISPTIINTNLNFAEKSILYYQKLTALGGTPSYSWSLLSGNLPLGITLSSDGILTGTPTTLGVSNFVVLVTDFQSRTDVQSYTLTVKSTGYDSRCCTCVFTNGFIDFNHNAPDGVLTATGGTIISNTRWQAPSVEGFYNVNISILTKNGLISVTNTINVLQKLELIGNSLLTNYLPGDTFSIETNYSPDKVAWEVISGDKSSIIPTANSTFYVNSDAGDNCFGAVDATLRGTLIRTDICNLISSVDVRVKINPIYPTPANCGPDINKWLRNTPDFRVISNEFEGGCDETHIRNSVPIVKWDVTYTGLNNYIEGVNSCQIDNCECQSNSNLLPYIQNKTLNKCTSKLKSSNRLDDFWNLVYGQYNKFTLVDYDTGEVWYNVKFNNLMSSDHVNRRTATSRNVQLIWRPCCNKNPSGGVCSRHGIVNYQSTYFNITNSLNILPPVATNPIVNDIINTFAWTIPAGYLLSDFEYTIDGGIHTANALSNPLYVGNNYYDKGQVGVRIKGTSTHAPSPWLFNDSPFTFVDNNDIIVPTGSITQPTGSQIISGTYTFRANASDASGIASVEFFIDGVSKGVDTTYPYFITLDANALGDGNHVVYARITDASVNANVYSTSSVTFSVSVPVNQRPVANNVRITGTPAFGSTLTGLFDYFDNETDLPATHIYKWYRADDTSGTNLALISGATNSMYPLQNADIGKYIKFAVIPHALTGQTTGVETPSNFTSIISAGADTIPPTITTFTLSAPSSSQVSVSYAATDSSAPVRFDLEFSLSGASPQATSGTAGWTALLTDSTASSPYVHTGRSNYTVYYYRLRARDSASPPNVTLTWSTANIRTLDGTAPSAPGSFTATITPTADGGSSTGFASTDPSGYLNTDSSGFIITD